MSSLFCDPCLIVRFGFLKMCKRPLAPPEGGGDPVVTMVHRHVNDGGC